MAESTRGRAALWSILVLSCKTGWTGSKSMSCISIPSRGKNLGIFHRTLRSAQQRAPRDDSDLFIDHIVLV